MTAVRFVHVDGLPTTTLTLTDEQWRLVIARLRFAADCSRMMDDWREGGITSLIADHIYNEVRKNDRPGLLALVIRRARRMALR